LKKREQAAYVIPLPLPQPPQIQEMPMTEIVSIMALSCAMLIATTIVIPTFVGFKKARTSKERSKVIWFAVFAALFEAALTVFVLSGILAHLYCELIWTRIWWGTCIAAWLLYAPFLIWLIRKGKRTATLIHNQEGSASGD
jgi:hypothetical protein